jgi:hypothetical protein
VRALSWLAAPATAPSPPAAQRLAAVHLIDPGGAALLAIHAPYAESVTEHARGALLAAAAYRRMPARATPPLATTVRRASVLWNERLFFEVHEVLEATWKTEAGSVRQALQGWIQIAVAYLHLAHGNLRGARSLLSEGRERLANVPPSTLPALDAEALLVATAPLMATLVAGDAPRAEPPPLVRLSD